jgi:hypothetical protein
MNGTLKLGIMVATTLLSLAVISWILAEIVIFLTKDD